ncbi:hypothetical protein [Halolamina sp. C58]|uniref:hypothetical protein n=1 Tax=Halolamina sp. C58 TaxID=3421640 RepID=UPI003EC0AAA7
MSDSYLKKGVSAASGTFTTLFGVDLITQTELVQSVLGSGDVTAIVGLGLAGVGGVTVWQFVKGFVPSGGE